MSGQRFKTLLIEDNPAEARLIRELLADETTTGELFDLEYADRLATGLVRLSAGDIDAVLLDLSLPDSQGSETFTRARAQAPDIAMIVLTDNGDEAAALNMVKGGAQDYLPKTQVNAVLLSRVIRCAVERKRAEQEIRKLNEELARRLEAQTVELEAANKELRTFYFSISHDLRAPLQGLAFSSQVLLQEYTTQIPAEARRFLRIVDESAKEMERLIEGLLNFSRLGRRPLMHQVVKLVSLVQEALEEFNHEREGRKVEVRLGYLPDCVGDPVFLKQVFINLLSNAFKFTRGREQALIEVDCREQQAEPVYFVRDNGAGFDMQYASKLFHVFQRLHPRSEFEGTGVGLSIVQRIVQRHGGRIWAEAKVDKGAIFYFTLPQNLRMP
jgi:two-component system, sensor histidine kinase and response regulator